MISGKPLKQDLWCPEGRPALKREMFSFRGPFQYITPCFENSAGNRKNRWCLMFVTRASLILMPVPPASLHPGRDHDGSADEPGPAKTAIKKEVLHGKNSAILDHLSTLVRHYMDRDPGESIIAELDTVAIPLDTIKKITITWVRNSEVSSRLTLFFHFYPAEPANASYSANYQLSITADNASAVVITPFSPELRLALRTLLGERVHEIPDEYAPLL